MTDDLNILRDQLRRPPTADPVGKEAALRLAMENFDRLHQETTPQPRPIKDRPQTAGFLKGLGTMLSNLTTRPILAATTSVAALCLGLIIVLPQGWNSIAPIPATPEAAEPLEARTKAPAHKSVTAAAPVTAQANAEAAVDLAMPTTPDAGLTSLAVPSPANAPLAEIASLPPPDTEVFSNADANPIKITAEQPVSTFSADVDTASYAVIRSSLMRGQLPPEAAVRVEEMVNYFPYAYAAPGADDAPFTSSVAVMPTPWNADTRLVRIGLQGRLPAVADRPPLNLVFLIDTSGSMDAPDKLPLLQQSLRLLLPQLRADDEVAIVAYAGSAGEVLPPTRAGDAATIIGALDRLNAGGPTAGAEGLELAYQTAQRMTAKGEVSRVLLATDGDFNMGISDPDGLETYIARKRESGIYLSVLGFGRGNLDDATMQALAQSGNGTAAYIDTLQEARKVLVDQLAGALFAIADDVKIQVEWNPAEVAEYRLIGYETRALAREDFNNDKVDAGEIGAGHSVTALYEVTAPGSPALANTALRYSEPDTMRETMPDGGELGFLQLRYKMPGENASRLLETPITSQSQSADVDTKFAAAIAGFGQLLTGGKYLGDWGWDAAIALALEGRGDDPFGYRTEAVSLMRLAQSLTAQ